MLRSKAALQINNAQDLAAKIEFFFDKKHQKDAAEFSNNARNFVLSREETLGNYMREIGKFLK